jgi:hypothetical protein
MSGSEARDNVHLRRQRLIERLNARETELAASQGGHPTGSKDDPEVRTEKERQRNYLRMGFAQMWLGDDPGLTRRR